MRLSTHLPSYMMYTLVLRYKVVPEEAQQFVKVVSEPVAARQALNMLAWDKEEGVLVMNEGRDAATRADEAADGALLQFRPPGLHGA